MAKKKYGLLSRTYAFGQRYRQILVILIKYGFEDLIAGLNIDGYLPTYWNPFLPKSKKKEERHSTAERIRWAIEEMGPTFIKMGQALSTRSDLFPEDILEELVKLQDRVPSFPGEEAKKILEREFKTSCDELFQSFEEKPIAAGSLGQVHRAVLKGGELVAVKVQRPHIRRKIEIDLEILHHMATIMENRMELGRLHRPSLIVDEFAKTLMKELDYGIEAANLERFSRLFSGHSHLYIHRLFREVSTSRVITTEFVEGVKPTRVQELKNSGLDPKMIARKGAELLLDQIFIHGYFHADPHPGNVLVLKKETICFLDFGMMGRLDRASREMVADLLMSVVQHKEAEVVDALLRLTHSHALVDRLNLEREIAELMDFHLYRSLKDLEVGKLIRAILDLTAQYELRIPAQFFLLIKTISQIEGMGMTLDPEFNLVERITPFIHKILINRYHPRRWLRNLYTSGGDLLFLLKDVPGEIRELLKQAKQGKIHMEFEHVGLRPILAAFDKITNRLVSAIVLAAMIVGSSLIVLSRVPPLWNEIPVIGLGGFVASGLMGVALLRSIWKNRGL